MKHIKTTLALSLVLVILLSFFACETAPGGESGAQTGGPGKSEDVSRAPEGSEDPGNVSYVPETRDLASREVKFLVPGSGYVYYESFEIYAGELTDESINDAVYHRNQIIADRYNCTISAVKSDNVAGDMRVYIGSNLADYDVYMPMINDAVKLVGEGLMLDLKLFDGLKLDQSWWDQKANEGLEVGGKLYFSTGDISILDNDCTMVMFFNKDIAARVQTGDLYQMVEQKTWTLDRAYELGKRFTQNLEDDTLWDNKDNYGLHVAFNAAHSFYFGCGGAIAEKTAGGGLEITIATDKNQGVLRDVFEIAFKPDVLTNKLPGCASYEDICAMFLNGQVLFTTFALTDIKGFRDGENFNFGILPYPLYNSEQDEYRCLVSTSLVPCVTLPANCKEPEDTALVLEAMAYYSVETLTKAYYDKTLKGRDLKDEASERMLDIIFSSRVYDLGYIYNFGGVGGLIERMNAAGSANFSSYYEAIAGMAESELQKTIETFGK